MGEKVVGYARAALCAAAALWMIGAGAASAQNKPVNLRGDVTSVAGDTVTLAERSGKTYKLVLGEKTNVGTLMAAKLSDVKQGDFIGTAAVPRADGKLVAQEVLIFPKGVRPGEGHRPWDLSPNSTMTNADVAGMVSAAGGEELMLKYKGGEKTVVVPPGTPVVTIGKPDRSALKPGAHAFALAAQQADGSYKVIRISVGKDGLVPPM
jgi:hypothetical protein